MGRDFSKKKADGVGSQRCWPLPDGSLEAKNGSVSHLWPSLFALTFTEAAWSVC